MSEVPLPEDLSTLTADQLLQVREELRLSRQVLQRQQVHQRLPFLPIFTGDTKGVDYSHFKSAIDSVQARYDETSLIQAIRKNTSGQAAKVLASLNYDTSRDDILNVLENSFGKVSDSATNWASFYEATQDSKESIVEWRTRLFTLYQKTGNQTDSDMHMKTRLYQGLRDQKLKEQALFKFEDSTVTEAELLRFLRRLKCPQGKTMSASAVQEDGIEKLKQQMAALTDKVDKIAVTTDKKQANHPERSSAAQNSLTEEEQRDKRSSNRGRSEHPSRNRNNYSQERYNNGNQYNNHRYNNSQPYNNHAYHNDEGYNYGYNNRGRYHGNRNYYNEHHYSDDNNSMGQYNNRGRFNSYRGPSTRRYQYDHRPFQQGAWQEQRYDGYHNQYGQHMHDPNFQTQRQQSDREGPNEQKTQPRKPTNGTQSSTKSVTNKCGKAKSKSKAKNQQQRERLIGRRNTDSIKINDIGCTALLDSGSVISSISEHFYNNNLEHVQLQPIESVFDEGITITSATGNNLNISGFVDVNVLFPGLVYPIPILMTVLKSSILDDEMPALVGSNALEEWKKELEKQNRDDQPKINSTIDSWKTEHNVTGVVHNTEFCNVTKLNCLYIKTKVTINDVRPYDRKIVFTPYKKFEQQLASTTLLVPQNASSVKCEIPVSMYKASTGKQFRLTTRKAIGTVSPIVHEINVPITPPTVRAPLGTNREEFMGSFDDSAWPSDHKQDITKLLWEYKDVFALSHHDLGCYSEAKHHIELTDHTPIRQKYRRIPPHLFEAVKLELSKLIESGVIQPSQSPWASPLSIAVKKDGSPRICLDYRKINELTKKDAKAIPNIDEMIDMLHGKTIFSSLDMMQGYYQQELDEVSREFTAFNAGPLGFYEFQRLPFGLTNASGSFQRMMGHVLRDLLSTVCLVYIDDVIIHSTTEQEHLNSLELVFQCLRKYNLRLKPSKCQFFQSTLKFLGHIVSNKGISADPDKVQAIKNWEAPKTVKQIRQFQGLTGFLRRYIGNYAKIAQPLTDLLKGYSNKKGNKAKNKQLEQKKFHWGQEQQKSFEMLKKKVAEDVTLAYPDFNKPFRLCCDASRNGLGAVLEQEQDDGHYRPIAFASRRTSDAEKQYPIHKLEFLSLKWSITEKFKDYLGSSKVVCYTDNNPLVHVFKSAKLDATSQRWLAQLEPYDFIVEYKPAANNTVADALSRKYDTDSDNNTSRLHEWARSRCRGFDADSTNNQILPAAITVNDTINRDITVNYDWNVLQSTDSTVSTVKAIISKHQTQAEDETASVKSLLKEKDNLMIHNDLLYYQLNDNPKRLVVPSNQQDALVTLYHSYGHFGITRVYKLLKQRFYWPKLKNSVTEACEKCERCQRAKTPKTQNKGPLTHIITPSKPMHQLSIDFLSIDTKAQTKCKILTCVDEFTKHAFGIVVTSENAKKCAEHLYRHVYTKFGIPEVIHSDRGATFLSKVIQELNDLLGIKHTITTPYRPQSNGSCERLNSTIISRMRTLQPKEKVRWHLHLDSLIFAYNSTVHESIGISPFSAMFGRHPKIPIDLLVRLPATDDKEVKSVKSFVSEREAELKESFDACARNIEKRQARSKRNHDDKLKQTVLEFLQGDKVLVRKFVTKNKIDDRYQAEIFEVIRKKQSVPLYLIKGLESGIIKTIHRDHLILFKQSNKKEKPTSIDTIITWENMTHKLYDSHEDEEYSVRKSFNKRIAINFGELSNNDGQHSLLITASISADNLQTNLKSARDNRLATSVISINYNHKPTIRTVLQTLRKELSHTSWDKIIVTTTDHLIYNQIIQQMCTFFPKTKAATTRIVQFSDSDDSEDDSEDDSDDEYYTEQPQEHQDNSDDPDEDEHPTVQQRPGHGYNLRSSARRPSVRLQDHYTYTLQPSTK